MVVTESRMQSLFDAMAEATRQLDTDAFSAALLNVISAIAPVDSMVAVAFPPRIRPLFLAEKTRKNVVPKDGDVAKYIDGAYLLDPFYRATKENTASGFYRLRDIAPDNFYESEYFRQYYQFSNLTDEVGYLLALDDGAYLHLSLARITPYHPQELNALEMIAPWLLAIVEKQWLSALSQTQDLPEEVSMHSQLSNAFENFGRSLLTDRECEVAQLILHGHSTKSMAAKLGISIETIKVHRRNLYAKLDISSQPELFSLFLESLALVGNSDSTDPLAAYHQPAPRH